MKLNSNSLVFEVDSKNFKDHHIGWCETFKKEAPNDERSQKILNNKIRFFKETGFRKLVFSTKSVNNLENYNVPEEIKLNVLRSLPNRKDIIMIDGVRCIKYVKNNSEVFITMNTRDDENSHPTHLLYLRIDLISGKISGDNFDFNDQTEMTKNTIMTKIYQLFMVTVTYLELTPVTLSIVSGGKKRGDILKSNLLKNETKSSVIQVNTNWNVRKINVDGCVVRGHWRLQPYGKGLSKYKYIHIDSYSKGLIRRLSQKESICVN